MKKKTYLETFKKCPGSLNFTLLLKPLKNMYSSSSLLIHKRCFCRIISTFFLKKNISEDILGKIDKTILLHLADFGHLGARGFG